MFNFKEEFDKYNVPGKIRKASESICTRFNINGICDPMYISNVIANESESGNGMNTFTSDDIRNTQYIAERLQFAYSTLIKKNDIEELKKILDA
ncbi:MAG: hypothetical protein K0R54_531 [Clostridiaceae bacterium]|jgi:hypothetical protein|nr:hypothetical protein [Clostridiaceae bacterium]